MYESAASNRHFDCFDRFGRLNPSLATGMRTASISGVCARIRQPKLTTAPSDAHDPMQTASSQSSEPSSADITTSTMPISISDMNSTMSGRS